LGEGQRPWTVKQTFSGISSQKHGTMKLSSFNLPYTWALLDLSRWELEQRHNSDT